MRKSSRSMRLNADHVALLARSVPPDGPLPTAEPATDEDYRRFVSEILEGSDGSGQVWLFAYGSLIWKPASDFVELRTGLLHGWHRAFCLGWDTWFRGSKENPGLMLALDRGGRCKGALYRLPSDRVEECLEQICRREMGFKPSPFPPRWVKVETEEGPVAAVTFCIDRRSGLYVSGLSDDEVATALSKAVGPRGSMVEYLFQTVQHLEQMDMHDSHLWRLQEMVADKLDGPLQ